MPAYYLVKWITWKEKKTPIITQSENGPCPLLAIMNTLFLRWKVRTPSFKGRSSRWMFSSTQLQHTNLKTTSCTTQVCKHLPENLQEVRAVCFLSASSW